MGENWWVVNILGICDGGDFSTKTSLSNEPDEK